MTTQTHYRKAFDSPYLSSADIVDPIALTIRAVALEPDRTKKTPDQFNTAHFVERELRPGEALKPMILNAGNSKFLAQLTGSKFIEEWVNLRVEVYVDPSVKFGRETVEGLRLRKAPPVVSTELLAAGKAAAKQGEQALRAWWSSKLSEGDRVSLSRDFPALRAEAKKADAAAAANKGAK